MKTGPDSSRKGLMHALSRASLDVHEEIRETAMAAPAIHVRGNVMDDLIIVTTRDARQFLTEPGNPHLICHGREVRVVGERAWHDFYAGDGALLIMSRADLAALDPGALAYDPSRLATLLTTFASDLAAS
jgi:hypothetical protein